jgi:hypothetical protein
MQQSPMYAAVINSPQTELSGAVDGTATTIPVVNAAVFPAGPNLATIGTDETAETIHYTGISGNSLTGVTRGFQSASKSWSAGAKIARYFTAYDHDTFKGNIEALASEVSTVSLLTSPLKPGPNIITPSVSSLADLSMIGQTLVNIPGKDGGFENLNGWTPSGVTPELSTAYKRSGNTSIKVVPTDILGSYVYRDYSYKLDPSKRYLALAWVYIESYTDGGVEISIRDRGTFETRYLSQANVAQIGSWQLLRIKIDVSNTVPTDGFRLLVGAGGAGVMTAYFDEVSIYEITALEYTAIDMMTADQIAARWPYVDSAQHVNAVHVRNPGRNLLPPFTEWAINVNAVVTEPYRVTLTGEEGAFLDSNVTIPVMPNQIYTLTRATTDGRYFARYLDANNYDVGTPLLFAHGSGLLLSFTIPSNVVRVTFYIDNSALSGTFTFANPMLNLGSAALPFTPQNPSYLYLPDPQAKSNVDSSVADTVYIDSSGKPRIVRRFSKPVILDGLLPWQYDMDESGIKRIVATGLITNAYFSGFYGNAIFIRFDGKVMQTVDTPVGDSGFIYNPGDLVFLRISDSDSGWTEMLAPSNNAVKALMNGWKAFNNNGTAYDSWVSILDGSAPSTNTEAFVAANKSPGWTCWASLTYQLAQSVDEELAYEGELALHDDPNQIELGTGIVVREIAHPKYRAAENAYRVNHTYETYNGSQLQNRAKAILQVYKDDDKDELWEIRNGGTDGGYVYGTGYAQIPAADYDPDAEYTVTYLALDTCKLGIAPQTASVQYAGNIGTTVSKLVQDQADLATEVSVHKWILTEDGAYIEDLRRDLDAHEADYVRQPGFGTTGGSANVYTLTLSPALTSYVEGVAVAVKIHAANTGASTININGLGARNILDPKGNAVLSGKLMANGVYSLRYNGTAFILQGEGGDYGTAGAAQVLTGYTIGTDAGIVSGTMPNQGAATLTPSGTGAVPIPAGYHNGSGTVSQVSVPAANVKTGTTIAGVAGTMPDRGATNLTPSGTGTVAIPAGYHNGSGVVAQVSVPAGNVLTGTTIAGVAGNMPNNGAPTITPGTSNQGIGAGYYSGGTVVGDPDLVSGNIKSGANIFGVPGSSTVVDTADANLNPAYLLSGFSGYDDGQLKAGTMPDRGGPTWTPGTSNQGLAAGYYSGGTVLGDPELIASNVRSGVNIFGVIGSLIEGKRWASGNQQFSSTDTVSGLNFTPSIILAATATSFATKVCILYFNGYNQAFVPVGGSYGLVTSFADIAFGGFRMANPPSGYSFDWFAVE